MERGGNSKRNTSVGGRKIPAGDGPYARAKRLQVVEKDGEGAILWYRQAIISGDRVDSALKDMTCTMKQQNQAEEAIEAIHSLRHLCSNQSQQSLDNLLIDLYKKCNRFDEQIHLLKEKLQSIYLGEAFNGKTIKTARSRGKKFKVSITQETARILGNLGWAYMQKKDYDAAAMAYRSALLVAPDANMACNLGLCLGNKGELDAARRVLEDVARRGQRYPVAVSDETARRAEELMREMEMGIAVSSDVLVNKEWGPFRSRRLPVFEEILPSEVQMAF